MIAPAVAAFAEEPVFVAVAVADAALRPTILRAAVITFHGDRARIVCADTSDTGPEALAAALQGQRAAVVIGSPTRAASFQLKGTIAAARPADEAELAEGFRRIGLLGEHAERNQGVPAELYQQFRFTSGVTIDVEVTACFDQTPGDKAGARLP